MRNPPTFCFLVLSLSLTQKERLSPENHAKSKCFVVYAIFSLLRSRW
jgi:hypothetical protein